MERKAIFVAVFAAIMVLTAGIAFPKTPTSESEFPVYQGAQRDQAAEKEESQSIRESETGGGAEPGIQKLVWLRIFKVGTTPEDVFRFYKQALGATADDGSGGGIPESRKPGTLTPVLYAIYFHGEDDFEDRSGEEGDYPGSTIRAAMAKDRKTFQEGQWINDAHFSWGKIEANGDETYFNVVIIDNSIHSPYVESGYKEWTYKRETRIEMVKTTGMSFEAAQEKATSDRGGQMDREQAAKAKELSGKAPTEKEMGVPPYPGAKLDVENSAGMSQEDYPTWIYMTNDPAQTVAAFYEKATKKKAVSVEPGSFIIPLVGQVPVPEHFVMIQANTMFPGGYKTVITIMRKR